MGKKKENSFLLGYYKKSLCIFVSYTPQLFKSLQWPENTAHTQGQQRLFSKQNEQRLQWKRNSYVANRNTWVLVWLQLCLSARVLLDRFKS